MQSIFMQDGHWPTQWRPGFLPPVTVRVGRPGPSLGQAGGAWLGQSDAAGFYAKAKQVTADFDNLAQQLGQITNSTVRAQLADTYGISDPTNTDKAQYMRGALARCIAAAESFTPVAPEQGFPTHGPCRGDVTKMSNFNADMQNDVQSALATYGALQAPVVVTQTSPLTLPLLAVGGAVAAAILIASL